jgi:hypothetical protein
MSSKDSALFESRKHNFSVLLSDDEEVDNKAAAASVAEEGAQQKVAVAASSASEAGDGFTTVYKNKKPSAPKPRAASVSSSTASPAPGNFKPFPKELIIPKTETSLEFFDFPATLRTGDLRKLLQDYEGHYRLKWNHDTSCFIVFDDSALGKFKSVHLNWYLPFLPAFYCGVFS